MATFPGDSPVILSNRRCIHVFQIGDDDLAVKRLELLNQQRQPLQIHVLVGRELAMVFAGKHFALFQTHEIQENAALATEQRASYRWKLPTIEK